LLDVLAVQVIEELLGRALAGFGGDKFASHRFEFAMVQPVTSTPRTTVHFDPLFHAVEMLTQDNVTAPGATQFLLGRTSPIRIPLHLRQDIAPGFVLFVKALQLEMIEPDAAAGHPHCEAQVVMVPAFASI
jgi:hypothetical protein